MSSAESFNNKKPSQTYLDLLHIANSNEGIDDSLRAVYGGNGEPTPLRVSNEQVAADFNDGVLDRAQIKNARWTAVEHEGVGGDSYVISLITGNYHKITLTDDLTSLSFAGVPDSGAAEITILIDAAETYSIDNWPVTTFWSSGVKPDFATQASDGMLLVRLLTMDGGSNWFGQVLGETLRSSPLF